MSNPKRLHLELNVSLNALVHHTSESLYNYVEEAATESGLLSPDMVMCDPQYDLIRHKGNEMWLDVSFEVSE